MKKEQRKCYKQVIINIILIQNLMFSTYDFDPRN